MRGLRGIAPPGTRYDYVSVHVPKTGGTTLLKALERRFRNRLYLHYPDAEPRGPFHTLSPVRAAQGRLAAPGLCVHGHVPASTHWHPDCKLLVFLREPAAQAVSNWRYIHRFHGQTGKVANEGWRDILEMDLETFLDQQAWRSAGSSICR